MERKGIPKKRIGPDIGCWERSIRMRQFKVRNKTSLRSMGLVNSTNAAERSAYGMMSTSLCGIKVKKENKNEKEVKKEHRQSFVSQVAHVGGSLRFRRMEFGELHNSSALECNLSRLSLLVKSLSVGREKERIH